MRIRILLCVFLLASLFSQSQDFSNKGTDFWLGYGYHVRYVTGSPVNGQEMVLYIATEAVTNVTVSIPALGYSQTYNNIPANTIFTTNPIPKAGAQDARLTTEGISSKGIHVTSSKPVVAYTHIYNSNVSGATLLFPTNTLGREYYSVNFDQYSNEGSSNCFFFVVATDTGTTTVEVIPSKNTQTMVAGTVYSYNLTQGQILNVLGTISGNNGVDLTGSKIRSVSTGGGACKRVAVFSGSGKINIRCPNAASTNSADNYIVQAFPQSAWGKKYLTTQTVNYPRSYYRVCVQDPSTIVKLNGTIMTGLVGNFYYQFENAMPNYIQADKPIMVAQYIPSQGQCGGTGNGDPEVIYLSPLEQNIGNVILNSTSNFQITAHYINVVIPTGGVSSFRLDGNVPSSAFVPHPELAGYSYLRQNVVAGQHTILSDSGFNAIAYGYGSAESYGYNAGSNILDLYQYVTLQNQYASVNFPATCKGTPFKFSITLPYQPLSITWDFNNSSSLSPNTNVVNNAPTFDSSFIKDGKTLYVYKLTGNYNFTVPGTYPIKVIVNNPTSDGCSGLQEISYDVTVYDKPKANFTFSQTGCVNDPINFTDQSNGNGRAISKWQWNFGDNTIDSVKNPIKTYTSPGTGTYAVKLTSFTDIGCVADTTISLPISSKPLAKFGVSDTTCAGKTIVFSDSSTIVVGNITKWYWDYGNGNKDTLTSNAIPRSQTYTTVNSYTVTLIVESNTGCKSVAFTKTIVVYPNPVVDFALPIVCLPIGAASFSNLTTIANGTINTVTYNWNFGDGGTGNTTTGLHNYNSVGPFTVKLTATSINKCIAEKSQTLTTVYVTPVASFTVTPETCLRDSTLFTSTSNAGTGNTITNWYWNRDFGGTGIYKDTLQAYKYRYGIAKTYIAKLYFKTDKGCYSDTATKTLIVNPLPTAQFINSSPLCEQRDILFTTQSVANAGNINRWYWNMGNTVVNNFTNNNPFTQAYLAWNNYTIKHMVETDKGCKSDTLIKVLNIRPLPKVGFVLPEVCLADAAAVFTDTSTIADGSQAGFAYNWTFNVTGVTPSPIPATAIIKNGSTKYNKSDNYQVKLKITSAAGCIDSLIKSFTVNGSIPVSNFEIQTPTSLCSNTPVQIKNTSTVDFGLVTKVEIFWDYLNNPTAKDIDDTPTPNKLYNHLYSNFQQPATKTFTIRFLAYSGGTCVNIISKTVTINASPKVQFVTMPGICLDATARQIIQATETGGVAGASPAFQYYGNGVNTTGLFTPTVAGVGTYPMKAVFTSNKGCQDSVTRNITVWPSPIAKFGISSPVCEKNALTFTDSSVANFSNIVTWNYNFGDATNLTRTNATAFTKTYTNSNTYNATLKVTTDSGCVSSIFTKTIKVNYLPVVNFSLPEICLPDGRGTFTNSSTILDNTDALFTYNWNFGDAANTTPSVLKNPTHQYSALAPSGGYLVKLKVTSNNGCVDSLTKPFSNVYPQPKANFKTLPVNGEVCIGDTIRFTDLSDGKTSAVNSWRWNFGDNSSVTTQNPIKKYSDTGSFLVKLFIFNTQGCVSDTLSKTMVIHPYPKLDAGSDLVVLEGGTIPIKPIYYATNPVFSWLPITYLDTPTVANPKTTPLFDITYIVKLTGIGGCSVSDDVKITVLRAPLIPNAFSPNGDGINDTWAIKYLESYPGATIEIYNRGGQLVYQSTNYPKNWDGTTNGKPLNVGTYYYIINPKNGRKIMSGSVTILK